MIKRLSLSVMLSFLVVVASAIGTILYLIFSTNDKEFYRSGLWGMVYAHAKENAAGNTELTFGIAHIPMLIIVVVAVAAVFFLIGGIVSGIFAKPKKDSAAQ
ncbi:hypothetical protein [Corynebacterium sp. sy039]|uniref:hypothetical protein n=1 Tax=Corynebacterium sp. sy039 TaxID=2599641 RepID=UPI0011B64308|nr:hypothetical protein [Corynebacterium sp. sy039]QDZ43246.1 hypothetical protein FQV43_08855 [Corynebacterium sp. sy039]